MMGFSPFNVRASQAGRRPGNSFADQAFDSRSARGELPTVRKLLDARPAQNTRWTLSSTIHHTV
jgi:hypothetical protein